MRRLVSYCGIVASHVKRHLLNDPMDASSPVKQARPSSLGTSTTMTKDHRQ
jgi:hypothetical protein